MLNQVFLVGRLVQDPEVKDVGEEKRVVNIDIAVQRSYKNVDGVYETDFIRCVLWNSIASNTSEYCKKGDIIGVKGRLQSHIYEDENGNKKYVLEVVAEKITFLSSSKQTHDE